MDFEGIEKSSAGTKRTELFLPILIVQVNAGQTKITAGCSDAFTRKVRISLN